MDFHGEMDRLITERIEHFESLRKQMRFFPRELPDGSEADFLAIDGVFQIKMPLDPPLNDRVRHLFSSRGWQVSAYRLNASMQWREATAYKHTSNGNMLVYLTAIEWMEGSTHKITLVGGKTVLKSINSLEA